MTEHVQSNPTSSVNDLRDELWMEEALRCAQRALEVGEVRDVTKSDLSDAERCVSG